MLLSVLILGGVATLQLIQGQTCEDFLSNQVCSHSEDNQIDTITDIESPALCQARCLAQEDCSHFSWIRFASSLPYPPACFLYKSCVSTNECGEVCDFSLTGPRSPAYPTICCNEFQTGLACDISPDNILDVESGVADIQACQQLCQELMPCSYFNYESALDLCVLLQSCNEKIPCGDCTSGPKYPDMDTCSGPGKQAAVLLGGNGNVEVEAWPCSSASIPDLPQARDNQPAAAIMSDGNLYLCGGYVSGQYTDTCDIYNKTAGTWVQGGLGLKMTEKRAYMPTIMVDKWAVAAGGYNGDWLNSWEYLEISRLGGAWIKGSFQLKTPREYHCGVAISSTSFVVVGGFNSQGPIKSLEKYSMTTGFVGNLPDLPVARWSHACTLTDDSAQLIVAGGVDGNYLSSVISLDLAKLTWTTLPSMIRVRYFLTLGIFYGKLTAFGGYGGRNTLETLNGTSWVETNLAIPRSYHSMVKTVC